MRSLVGLADPSAYDNPTGALVYPTLPPEAFEAVFDFGCGCGRVARQLIQQDPRPERYLGIDIHRGMIEWCRSNLTPAAPDFEFQHHDVFSAGLNPGDDKPSALPFPAEDDAFTLVNAHSVFTHLTQDQTEHYLREVARILRPDGFFRSTWFFFEKTDFPFMQEWMNALYINLVDPSSAVVYDRSYVRRLTSELGLALVGVDRPLVRGFQWTCVFTARRAGIEEIELPADEAPVGLMRPPDLPAGAHRIGLPE
jgi:SAM-dependent methyltransferase